LKRLLETLPYPHDVRSFPEEEGESATGALITYPHLKPRRDKNPM
jgi:hypothetical protein